MKILFTILAISFLSLAARAEEYRYECNLVDNFDDWTVRVGQHKANFFDNDSNCILSNTVGGKNFTYIATQDCNYEEVKFVFNQKKMTAELQFPKGLKLDKKTVKKLAMTCKEGTFQD